MKFKNKNKVLLSSGLSVSTAALALIAISCEGIGKKNEIEKSPYQIPDNDQSETKEFIQPTLVSLDDEYKDIDLSAIDSKNTLPDKRKKSSNFITKDQNVKYLALGDSITAGFDGTLTQDYPGKKEADSSVSGLSYASFFARILNDQNRLDDFNNYAVSGSTAHDWIGLLKHDVQHQYNISSERLVKKFGNNYALKSREIKSKLAEANLITISIGANDLIQDFLETTRKSDFVESILSLFKKDAQYGNLVNSVKNLLDKAILDTSKKIATLASIIRELAPNANINFVSYPVPELKLKSFIDKAFENLAGNLNFKISDYVISILNEQVKANAIRNKANYVNLYNSDFWSKNNHDLSSIWIDIHPNTKGYKKMALDLYLKLTNDFSNVEKYKDLGDFDFDENYIKSDINTSNYQIEINNDFNQYKQALENHAALSSFAFINNKSRYESNLDLTRNVDNFGKRITTFALNFDDISVNVLLTLLKSQTFKKIDPNGILSEFLSENDFKHSKEFVEWLANTKILIKIINNIQHQLDQKYQENPDFGLNELKDILLNSVSNQQMIFEFVKSFAQSDFIQKNKDKLKEITTKIVSEEQAQKIKNLVLDFVPNLVQDKLQAISLNTQDLKEFIDDLISASDIAQILKSVVYDFLETSDKLDNVNNFEEFAIVLLQNQNTLKSVKDISTKIIDKTFNNPKIVSSISHFLSNLLLENELITNEQSIKVKQLITDVLSTLKDNQSIVQLANKFVEYFIEGISKSFAQTSTLNESLVFSLNYALDKIKTSLSSLNFVVEVIQDLNKSQILQKNKQLLKDIVSNLLNSPKKLLTKLTINVLPNNIKNLSNLFIGQEFEPLLDFVYQNQNFKNLVLNSFDSLIDNSSKIIEDKNSDTVILKLTQVLSSSQNIESVKKLLEQTFEYIKDNDIIKRILISYLNHIKLNPQLAHHSKFINEFSNFANEFLTSKNIANKILDILQQKIQNAASVQQLLNNFAQLPQEILNILFNQDASLKGILSSIFESKLLKDNKESISQIASASVDYLAESNNLKPLLDLIVKPLISPLNEQFQEIIVNLYSSLIKKEQSIDFIKVLVQRIISQQDWIAYINTPTNLIYTLLKDKYVLLNLPSFLNNVADVLIENKEVRKELLKIVSSILKDEKLDQNIDNFDQYIDTVYDILISRVLNDSNIYTLSLFVERAIKQTNSFDEFVDYLKQNFLSNFKIDAFGIVKDLTVSDLFGKNKQKTKTFVSNLARKFVNKEIYAKVFDSLNLDQFIKDTNSLNNLKESILKLIDKGELEELLTLFVEHISDSSSELAQAFNFNSYVKILFSKPSLFSFKFQAILGNFVELLLDNEQIQDLVATYIFDAIDKSGEFDWIFEGVEYKKQTIKNIFRLLNSLKSDLHLNESLSVAVIKNFATYGISYKEYDFFNPLVANIAKYFAEDQENKVVNLIKKGVQLPSFRNLNSDLKTIFSNIITNSNKYELLVDKLVPLIEQIPLIQQKITHTTQLNNLAKFILNSTEFKSIISHALFNLFDNLETLKDVNSYSDIINKLFANVDVNEVKQNTSALYRKIIENNDFKVVAKDLLNSLFDVPNLDADAKSNLISDLIDESQKISDLLKVEDVIIPRFFELIKKLQQQHADLSISNFMPDLIQTIKDNLLDNPLELIKKITALSTFTNNKSAIITIADYYAENVYKSIDFSSAIDSLANSVNAEILEYVDLDEVKTILKNILSNNNTLNIFRKLIPYLVNNTNWITLLNNPKQIVDDYIFASDFNNQNAAELGNFVIDIVSSQISNLSKTFTKTLVKVANKYQINLNKSDIEQLSSDTLVFLKSLLDSQVFDTFKANLILAFKNATSIQDFSNKAFEALLQWLSLKDFGVIKLLLNSDLLSKNTQTIKQVIRNIFEQLKTSKIASDLVEKIDLSSFNIDEQTQSQIKAFIKNNLANSTISSILTNSVEFILDNVNKLKKANNLNELINLILKEDQFIDSISTDVISLINDFLSNEKFINLTATFVQKQIENSQYSWIFTNVKNKELVLKQILKLYSKLDSKLQINANIINSLKQSLKRDGINLDISQTFTSALTNIFSNLDEMKITAIVKVIFESDLLKTSLDDVKTIINNIFNYLKNNSNIVEKISSLAYSQLKNNDLDLIDLSDIQQILNHLINEQYIKDIVNIALENTNNLVQKANEINSLNDLINNVLKVINYDIVFEKVDQLLNSLLTQEQFINITHKLIKNSFSKFLSINIDSQIDKFALDLSKNLNTLVNTQNFKNNLFSVLKQTLNNFKVDNNATNIADFIVNNLSSQTNQIISDPINFAHLLFKNEAFTQNKNAFLSVFKALYTKITQSSLILNKIESLINKNANSTYDPQEINNLFKYLINNNDFNQLIMSALDNAISNGEYLVYPTLEQTIFNILKNSRILNSPNSFAQLINNTFEDVNLEKTFTLLFVNNVQKHANIVVSNKLAKDIYSLVPSLLKHNDLLTKILSSFNQSLNKSNSLSDLSSNLLADLVKVIDFNDFTIFKTILSSDIFANNANELKQLVNTLFDKYITNSSLDFVDSLSFLDSLTQLNINKTQITNALKELLKSNTFKEFVTLLTSKLIDSRLDYSQINSWNDFIKEFLKLDSQQNSIPNKLTQLIKELLQKSNFKEIVSKLIESQLNSETFNKIFAKVTHKNELIKEVINLYDVIDTNLNISELLSSGLISAVAKNGLNINISNLFNSIFTSILEQFKDENSQTKVFNLIQSLLKTKIFTEYKQDLEIIAKNIFNMLKDDDSVLEMLAKYIADLLPQNQNINTSKSDIKTILKIVVNDQNFANIFDKLITNTIKNVDQYKNATDLNDLLNKFIISIDVSALKNDIKGLLKTLLTNSSVQDSIYNILINLLKTYSVDVQIDNISEFVRNITHNIEDLVNSLDLIDPIINTLTQAFENAKTATNKAQAFEGITQKITNLFAEKITNKPKQVVDTLLNKNYVQNNINSLKSIAKQLIKHFIKDQNTINLAFEKIKLSLVDKNVDDYINFDAFKELITNILSYPEISNIIDNTINLLIDNREWIAHLSDFNSLISQILTIPNFVDTIKSDLIKVLEKATKEKSTTLIMLKALNKVAKDNNINIDFNTYILNIESLKNNIFSLLEDLNVKNQLYDSIFETLKEGNLQNLADKLPQKIIQVLNINFADYSNIKKIINSNVFSNSQLWKDLIINLVTQVLNTDINSKIAKAINITQLLDTDIDATKLSNVVNNLLNYTQTKNILVESFKQIFDNFEQVKQANSYLDLAKVLLNQQDYQTIVKNNVKSIFTSLISDENLVDIVSKIAYTQLNKSNLSSLLKDIKQPQKLIANLIKVIPSINSEFNIYQIIIDAFVDSILASEENIEIDLFVKNISKAFGEQLKENVETKILSILKTATTNPIFSQIQESEDFVQLITNIFDYLKDNNILSDLVYNQIPQQVKNQITQLIEPQQLKGIIKTLVDHPNLKELVVWFIRYLRENKDLINSQNSLIQLLQNIFKNTQNAQFFKTKMRAIITSTLNDKNVALLLKNAINSYLKYSGVNVKIDNIEKLINDLSNNINGLVERLGIVDNLLDSFVSKIQDYSSIFDFINSFIQNIATNIKITEYSTFTKLISDQAVAQNKEALKSIFRQLLNSFVASPDKLAQTLESLSIASLISSDNTFDASLVNKALANAIGTQGVSKIVQKIISDIVDKNLEYAQLDSWAAALSKIIKEDHSNVFKDNVKQFIRDVFNTNDLTFANALAEILVNKLNSSGEFRITNDKKPLVSRFLHGLLKGVANSDEYAKIIDQIFNNIKNINYTNQTQYINDVIKAVKKGALSIITNSAQDKISISKILSFSPLIDKISANINPSDYSAFINLLFDASDFNSEKGIYAILKPILMPGSASSNNSNSSTSQASGDEEKPLGVEFNFGDIFSVVGDSMRTLKSIFRPLYKALLQRAARGEDFYSKRDIPEFKALYRINAIILWFLRHQNLGIVSFWNTNLLRTTTVEGIVNQSQQEAYEEEFNKLSQSDKDRINRSSQHHKRIYGYAGNGRYTWEYIYGSRSNFTSNSNYSKDQLLAYVYYVNSNPADRFNPSVTKSSILWKSLKDGHL
ncbi:SGNH/GDSL hydrolase family protein [Mycoplasmopsis ciconiae]|uniref:SGNH/GDSL hydrolase family protein n=1 Tax=Mycoplasmopsis ciconiae TaxID=561067 RepID=A0ABU7MLM7_9BACT|nr:SGNH/GDSL hydrolase family protein [Mycoplasmopsis ciconiae]